MTTPAAQPGLFDLPTCSGCLAVGYNVGHAGCLAARPLYGRTDPGASRLAAERIIASGQLGRDQMEVLALVNCWPGKTVPELARYDERESPGRRSLEWHRQRIGRRMSELESAGLIRAGESKPSLESGRLCQTWWPTAAGQRYIQAKERNA